MSPRQDENNYLIPATIVKAARALVKWSQKDLADKINVDISTIARFESGSRLQDRTTRKIIDIFDEHGIEIFFKNGVAIGIVYKTDG